MPNKTGEKNKRDILVLGDYARDFFLYAEKWREKSLYIREAPRKDYEFEIIDVPGGAGALVAYLRGINHIVNPPKEEEEYLSGTKKRLKSFYILRKTREANGSVWRVDKSRGSLPWGEGGRREESTCLNTSDLSCNQSDQCVIVMDFDGGWREKQDGCGPNWKKLAACIGDRPYLIRSHDPLKDDWQAFREKAEKGRRWAGYLGWRGRGSR